MCVYFSMSVKKAKYINHENVFKSIYTLQP
jgi:hypothetical protein